MDTTHYPLRTYISGHSKFISYKICVRITRKTVRMLRQTIVVLLIGIAVATPDPPTLFHLNSTAPIAQTPLGSVLGSILATRHGKPIYAFRGIRYAKAPIDDLRFQPPVAVEKWEDVFNATRDGPSCPQPDINPTSEDCLLLNVYTKSITKEADKQPVLVFFHGGGYYSGSGSSESLGPKYLLDKDLVLVIPNYRLGPLGFLSTGDKEAPGNNGLKDQVEVLKWVKENIASFGGDPENVTIGGQGSGASAVTLHLVSPLSKGLFHKAFAMSGSSTGPSKVPKGQLDMAKKLAKLVSCPDDNSVNIMKCLKTKPVEEIVATLPKFREFGTLDPYLIWLPVIEEDFGQPRFLSTHPVELILRDKFSRVPFLSGITTDELVGHAFSVFHNPKLLQDLDKEFDKYAPIIMLYERDTEHSKNISRDLRKFYFDKQPLDNLSLAALAEMYADGIIGFGVNRVVKLISQVSDDMVYYYRFNYKGRHSSFYLPDSNNTVPYGVAHGDDLIYLFHNPTKFSEYQENDPETNTILKMTELWGNFVIFGNPTPQQYDYLDNAKWEPFDVKTKKILDIGNKIIINNNIYEKRYTAWENMFPLNVYDEESNKTQKG